MRLDQWLWAIRVFHTRSIAAEAMRSARVRVDGVLAKPAHKVRPGELISVHFWDHERAWRVLGAPRARVGAKLVPQYAEAIAADSPAKAVNVLGG